MQTEPLATDFKPKFLNPNLKLVDAVVDQIAIDLNDLFSSAAHIKNKTRMISDRMEIDKKTIMRLMEKGSKPNYMTVFKIYRYLLNEFDEAKLLDRCPEVIKTYLKSANAQTFEKNISYSGNINKEFISNPIFAEIYVLCSTGPLKTIEVEERFGLYGKNIIEKMLKMNVLAEPKKGEYVLGLNQTSITNETILSVGLHIVESYAKPQNAYELDTNGMHFYSEGLTENAYLEWLRIDKEAFNKKIELANKPSSKGTKRVFTFGAVDTLEIKDTEK